MPGMDVCRSPERVAPGQTLLLKLFPKFALCVLTFWLGVSPVLAQKTILDDIAVAADESNTGDDPEEAALKLTKQQQEALSQLRLAWQAKQRTLGREWTKKWRIMQEEYEDDENYTRYALASTNLQKDQARKTEELEKEFLADMQALLTPEQMAAWPKYERAKRRSQLLMSSEALSGDAIDLHRVYSSAKLPPVSKAIEAIFDRYDTELDAALLKRKTELESLAQLQQREEEAASADSNDLENFDPVKMRDRYKRYAEFAKRTRQASIAVRNLNDRFAAQLAEHLPEGERSKLTDAYEAAKFPEIFRDSRARAAIESAKHLELPAEKKTLLDDLLKKYDAGVAPLNKALAREQAKDEADGGSGHERHWLRNFGENVPDNPNLKLARKAKRTFERSILAQVREIVGPDLEDSIPY